MPIDRTKLKYQEPFAGYRRDMADLYRHMRKDGKGSVALLMFKTIRDGVRAFHQSVGLRCL